MNTSFFENDSDLQSDLIKEAIFDRGIGVKYITRESVLSDDILKEPVVSKFSEVHDIDVYINESDGYFIPNVGFDFSGFNLSQDFIKLEIHRKTFDSIVGSDPTEGDLIYFHEYDRFFEVSRIDHKDPLASGGRLYTWDMFVQVYSHSTGSHHFDEETLSPAVGEESLVSFLNSVQPEDHIETTDSSQTDLTADHVGQFLDELDFTADSALVGEPNFTTADEDDLSADQTNTVTTDQESESSTVIEENEISVKTKASVNAQNKKINEDFPEILETETTNSFDFF